MKYFWLGFQKYAVFSGRANRKEYWCFQFLSGCLGVIIMMLIPQIGIFIYAFLFLIPGLSVTVRRLHDVELSGWWSIVTFIPFGWLALLFALVKKGDLEENKYGSPSLA